LCLSSSSIFPHYYFCVHHPVNRDDRHLLALATGSDISVTGRPVSKFVFILTRNGLGPVLGELIIGLGRDWVRCRL
jgi:hypothetical protein